MIDCLKHSYHLEDLAYLVNTSSVALHSSISKWEKKVRFPLMAAAAAARVESLLSLKEAIHKIQLSLLEGINNENHLFAAGSLLSRSDYEDVVTERSISNTCGYPLCRTIIPSASSRPRKGRYRISLKEHKVYDLQETYLYCSTPCVVKSKTFAESLKTERCEVSDSGKIKEVLRLIGKSDLNDNELSHNSNNGRDGFSDLKIQENENLVVKMEQMCIGPSNAIEGYVPLADRSSSAKKPSTSAKKQPSTSAKKDRNESKRKSARPKTDKGKLANDLNFTSTILMGEQFSLPEPSLESKLKGYISKLEESEGDQFINLETSYGSDLKDSNMGSTLSVDSQFGIPKIVYDSPENASNRGVEESKEEVLVNEKVKSNEGRLKSSLKVSGAKKLTRSVTWVDERKTCTPSNVKLCEVEEVGDATETVATSSSSNEEIADGSPRRASAEACAVALSEAAEAVASGEADVTNAVSEAGLVILPQPHDVDQYYQKNDEMIEADLVPLKWQKKPGVLNSGVFDTEDSWYEPPPEGFSLNLSSFATMYMALFGWITSSSLAYIYGQDDDTHEEFVVVNGREYPHKIVLSDGRSSEIKLTLAGCLGRVLPKVATDLRLKTPISTIEKEVGQLLNTMSFVDSIPPFKLKQWHVIALLFMDALSVRRIPGLAPHKTSWQILLQKVLDGAHVSGEEYETTKDLLIPLGRVPQFSKQCGA